MKEFQKCIQALKRFGDRQVRQRIIYAGYQFSVNYRQIFYGGFDEVPDGEYLFYTPKKSFRLEDELIVPRTHIQSVIVTDPKAFKVLNEITFGKLTVVIPSDETLIAIMVSEYMTSQTTLDPKVLDILLTQSDPIVSHLIYTTLGNKTELEFNEFCTAIDRYEEFFEDFDEEEKKLIPMGVYTPAQTTTITQSIKDTQPNKNSGNGNNHHQPPVKQNDLIEVDAESFFDNNTNEGK